MHGLAKAHLERDIYFANDAKCTDKVMSTAAGQGRYAWIPSVGLEDTVLLISEYLAGNWPKNATIVCITRRTHLQVDDFPTTRRKSSSDDPLPADPSQNDLTGTRDHGTIEEYATPVCWT